MAGLGPQARRRPAAHDLKAQLCVLQLPTAESLNERFHYSASRFAFPPPQPFCIVVKTV